MSVRTNTYKRFFHGSYTPGTSAGADEWIKKDTSAAGAPTMATGVDGLKSTLAATNEAEVLTFYFGDIKSFDIDDLISAEFILKANATFGSNETLVIGMAGDQNDDPDAITYNSWFKIVGGATANTALLCESDDNVTDVDDKATGISLGTTTHKSLIIDFSEGISSRSPPATSKGKQLHFRATDANGVLRRVCDSVAFDMSGYTGGLQPFLQLQKASGTGVPAVSLLGVIIEYRLPV